MKTIWSKEIDEVLKVGQFLDNVGVKNWALTKNQALKALDQFLVLGVSVLGGDVYEEKEGIIQSNYDNWHCDLLSGESKADFLESSFKKSKAYIETYKAKDSSKTFFVLVPSIVTKLTEIHMDIKNLVLNTYIEQTSVPLDRNSIEDHLDDFIQVHPDEILNFKIALEKRLSVEIPKEVWEGVETLNQVIDSITSFYNKNKDEE